MLQANGRSVRSVLICMVQILFNETEKLLEKWKHPDPYRPPTAPGGMANRPITLVHSC